jgi:DNA repair exonuclease SbcCD ATPase subunit
LVFIRRRQELEDQARERYSTLDQMSSELRRLREQRDALNTLVEALRTGDGWLAYRAEALRDHLLELEAQTAEGASTVEMVRTTLVDRDEALQRVRKIWRRRTLWRWSGRLRWPWFVPSFNKIARTSRKRVLGNTRPRRRLRRRRS